MPLKNSVSRAELRTWHEEISRKLAARGIHIVSYNVDGVEIERGLTHELQNDAFQRGKFHSWTFRNPVDGEAPLAQAGVRPPLAAASRAARRGGTGQARPVAALGRRRAR